MFHFEVFEWVKRSPGRPKIFREPKPPREPKIKKPRYELKYPDRPLGTRGQIHKTNPDARELQMRDWYIEGKTLQEIGDLQNPPISRERVRQLIKKYFNITAKDGGCFVASTPKKIANEIERLKRNEEKENLKYAKYFHCSKEQFLAINKKPWSHKIRYNSIAGAYYQQRMTAVNIRFIKWNITFPEWWKIWDESGKWKQRGQGGKKYCMTRIGDIGGYEVGNVEIKTNAQNFSDSYYKHPAAERIAKRAPFVRGTKTHCNKGHKRTIKNTNKTGGCKDCINKRAREANHLRKKQHAEQTT